MRAIRRLLVSAYLIEAGLLLMVVPWTDSWTHNYFTTLPWLGAAMANAFVSGGVSGVGLVTAVTGLRDLTAVVFARYGHNAAGESTSNRAS